MTPSCQQAGYRPELLVIKITVNNLNAVNFNTSYTVYILTSYCSVSVFMLNTYFELLGFRGSFTLVSCSSQEC